MKRAIVSAVFVCCGLSFAFGQSAQLPSTQLMKQQGQLLYRDLNAMVKGEAAFDPAKATLLVANLVETAAKIPEAFPETSKGKTSADSRYAASPKVWEMQAEFRRDAARLAEVLAEYRQKAGSPDELKATYSAINNACNACHETFRLRNG
jgi:cytochrome c556